MKTMTLRVLVSMVCLVLVGAVARGAESGTPVEGPLFGPALARDSAGHLYLAGHADDKRVFLTRLDPTGGVLLRTELDGFDAGVPLTLAVTSAGEAVVAGSGGGDAVIVRVAADGRTVIFRTVFGGKGLDAALAVALDADGNAWVAGRTASADLRAEGALTGVADAFLAEVDPAGTVLYVTYLGGAAADEARGVALDKDGAVYVTGSFGTDAFLAKFAPKSATLVYTTPYGGARDNVGVAVAVTPSGDVMMAGTTRTAEGKESGAFVAAFDPASGALRSSTDAGVAAGDGALALAVDRHGAAWIAGTRAKDAVAWRVETDAAGSIRTELLAGESDDLASGVVVDGNGDAWVAGLTRSATLRDAERPERALGGDVFLAHLAGPASPQGSCPGTKTFTGAVSLAWENAGNWSGGTLPATTDDVCISGFNVTLSTGPRSIQSLHVQSGSLAISNGGLTLAAASEIDGPLTLSGTGTVNGAGNLTVAGLFTWSGGTLSGAGTFTTNGATSLNSIAAINLQRVWNVNAAVTWTSQVLVSALGGTINNASTWDCQGFSDINGGTFNNTGTVKKSAGAGASNFNMAFNNNGSVLGQVNMLGLNGSNTSTGSFDAATGATVRFSGGSLQVNAGTTFTGSGTIEIGGANVVPNTPITIPSTLTLAMTFGVLGGGPATSPVTTQGTFRWTGGTLLGSPTMTCNGPLLMSPGQTKTMNGKVLHVNGGAVMTDGLTMTAAAVINNNSGSTFDVQNDVEVTIAGNPTPQINNAGTFKKSGGINFMTVQFALVNSGSLQVGSGTLEIISNSSNTGSINVSAGATLQVSAGALVLNAGTSFTGAGTVLVSNLANFTVSTPITLPAGITMELLGGFLNVGAGLTTPGTFNWTGGTLAGPPGGALTCNGPLNIVGFGAKQIAGRTLNTNGTTTFTSGTSLTVQSGSVINNAGTWDHQSDGSITQFGVSGVSSFINSGTFRRSVSGNALLLQLTFQNSGTVEVLTGSAATLSFDKTYTQIASNGVMNVEIGGITPGTQHDRVDVTGAAALAGVLNVSLINGYVPAPGDSFTIMTYASRTGTFVVNPPAVPCINWQVNQGVTSLVLTAVAAPPPVEIAQLASTSKTTMTWAAGSAAGIVYDVMRGDLSTLPVGPAAGETCLANGLASTSMTDLTVPTAGTGFWYVVRGRVATCGTGTYGFATGGIERTSTACP